MKNKAYNTKQKNPHFTKYSYLNSNFKTMMNNTSLNPKYAKHVMLFELEMFLTE